MQTGTLRTKFLTRFLPLFLGSFIVLFGICYYLSNQSLTREADVISAQTGRTAALEVEKIFQRQIQYVAGISKNTGIIYGDREARTQILDRMFQDSKGFAMLAFSDVNGQAFSNKGKDMDRSDRDYIKAVRETKQPFVTGPSISGSTGKLITVIAYPVMDEAGQLVGILYGTVELDEISNMVGGIRFFASGRVFLADQEGKVIADGQHPEDVGQRDLSVEQSTKENDARLVQAFASAKEQKTQVSTEYVAADGVESEAVVTPVELGYRTWLAVATAPLSEIRAEAAHLVRTMAIAALVMLVGLAAILWMVAGKIAMPAVKLLEECSIINSGDLRERELCVVSDDEFGKLAQGFADMRNSMRKLLRQIQIHAEKVSASAEELTDASHQSAEASNQVAVSVTDIAGGIAAQSDSAAAADATARTVAEHAVSVADNANALSMVTSMAVERVADGRTSIQKIVASMETINESATKVQASISELARRSDEISNIVDLITGIAAQTNLLALNAAIEAARAGEQGKGFAVVADEVRKLAEESANSSQQIAALVARIQDEMNGAVEASRQSTESVASSIESVHEADGIFESIRLSIEALAGGIAEVSNNIGDISSGVQGMQKNADDISSISKENANRTQAVSATTEEQSASNQEIAAATRSLSELAEQLTAEVGKFRLS